MTKEDKELLLKDLSARVPYGVKFNYGGYDGCDYKMEIVSPVTVNNSFPIEDCKPYLRPMSSMTEEERNNLRAYCRTQEGIIYDIGVSGAINSPAIIDWLNKNMFDYRGLIERGLALEAPEDMYK